MIDNIKINKKRVAFYETFYIYCYYIIKNLPSITRKDKTFSCDEYLIEVHREYHEPYKKCIANNIEKNEINRLLKSIKDFSNAYKDNIDFLFEIYKSNIECFNKKDGKLLNDFFMEFKQLSSNHKDGYNIFTMAKFLTTFRRMINEIKNLNTLNLLKFQFKSNKLTIITDEFYQVETFLKTITDFQVIRQQNIMKNYSQKDD